ncbi:hypothetical protein HI914_05830 [Erysiphe necator]|nr:hypothetical protein HI914_05830 [Erysiphe necator]
MTSLPPIYFLDGGLGTTLVDKFGCKFDDSTPLWSSQLLLSPSGNRVLQKCHIAFVEAGADLITSATYQASTREFINFLNKGEESKCNRNSSHVDKDYADTERSKEGKEPNEILQLAPDALENNRKVELEEQDHKFRKNSMATVQAHRKMRNAIKLARSSFGGKQGKVVLGLGAAGACLKPSQEYTGNYAGSEFGTSISSIRKWHFERLSVFIYDKEEDFFDKLVTADNNLGNFKKSSYYNCWNDIDLVGFETLPLLQEIIAVREAMAEVHEYSTRNYLSNILATPASDTSTARVSSKEVARKDFWISCVFPNEEYHLPDGSSITEVLRSMLCVREKAETPMGVGINCTSVRKLEGLIQNYENAITEMISKGEIKNWPSLFVYPDGTNGEIYNTETHNWETKKVSNFNSSSWDEMMYDIVKRAQHRAAWKSIYAGGCCKTTPDDIKKLRSRWKS